MTFSSFCSAVTAAPDEPRRIVVFSYWARPDAVPRGGTLPRLTMRAQVAASSTPDTVTELLRCQVRRAVSVAGPNTPSAGVPMTFCARATSLPEAPTRSVG